MSDMSARVVRLRESLGLTQTEAAARSPYSQATWSRIESGAKEMHLGDALAVASALGCFVSTVTGRGDFVDGLQTAARADSLADAGVVLDEMAFFLEAKSRLRTAGFVE